MNGFLKAWIDGYVYNALTPPSLREMDREYTSMDFVETYILVQKRKSGLSASKRKHVCWVVEKMIKEDTTGMLKEYIEGQLK